MEAAGSKGGTLEWNRIRPGDAGDDLPIGEQARVLTAAHAYTVDRSVAVIRTE
ncbi:hypothetical protein [Nocardia sp. NPDC047654]|uniref:hypothetical protein n=1 Tax=Nocardia sp. NPDC047654 TaxID=3364314 RepID=UPI0037101343